jgi:hypothetical protein
VSVLTSGVVDRGMNPGWVKSKIINWYLLLLYQALSVKGLEDSLSLESGQCVRVERHVDQGTTKQTSSSSHRYTT